METRILVAAYALLRGDILLIHDRNFSHSPDPCVIVCDVILEIISTMYAALVDSRRRIIRILSCSCKVISKDILAVITYTQSEGIAVRVIHCPGYVIPGGQICVIPDHRCLAGNLIQKSAVFNGSPELNLQLFTGFKRTAQLEDQCRFRITEVTLNGLIDLFSFHVHTLHHFHICSGQWQRGTSQYLHRMFWIFIELHTGRQDIDHNGIVEISVGLGFVVFHPDRVLNIRRFGRIARHGGGAKIIRLGNVHDGQFKTVHIHISVSLSVLSLLHRRCTGRSPLGISKSYIGFIEELCDLNSLSRLLNLIHLHQYIRGSYLEALAQHIALTNHGFTAGILGVGCISGSGLDLLAEVTDAECLCAFGYSYAYCPFRVGKISCSDINRLIRRGSAIQIDFCLDAGLGSCLD